MTVKISIINIKVAPVRNKQYNLGRRKISASFISVVKFGKERTAV